MNHSKLWFLAITICVAIPAFSQSSIPQRKTGLWEEMSTSSLAGPKPSRALHCVGSGRDHSLDMEMWDASDEGSCTATVVNQTGGRLVLEKRCKMGKSSARVTGTYQGNFDSAYEAAFITRITPPSDGHSELTANLKARWIGPCTPSQRPGDVVSDGGIKLNLIEIRNTPVPKCEQASEPRGSGPRPAPGPC